MRAEIDGMLVVQGRAVRPARQPAAGGGADERPRFLAADRRRSGRWPPLMASVPVVCLADALDRAVRAQPRGCPAGLYFDRLRDAIGCERLDEAASEALLASVSIRLSA